MRGLIYSFHMPLFFILSCTTFRFSTSKDEFIKKTKKAAKHLIIPALITFILIILLQCMKDTSLIYNVEYWKNKFYTFIFSSVIETTFAGFKVEPIGIQWFFFALFFGRSIFDYIHLKIKSEESFFITTVILGLCGILCVKTQWLPFCIDIALAVMPFFYFGYWLKNYDISKRNLRRSII